MNAKIVFASVLLCLVACKRKVQETGTGVSSQGYSDNNRAANVTQPRPAAQPPASYSGSGSDR